MSWALPDVRTTTEKAEKALARARSEPSKLPGPEAEQLKIAKKKGGEIAASGALGEGKVRIAAHGHANPDHEEQAGVVNDYVTVSVERVYDEPASSA
jgi:hypothetical protein